MESRTPAFCSVCGSKLTPSEIVQGYDPYTGNPVSDNSLYCNNPTVTSKPRFLGYGTTNVTYHPSWTQDNGTWVSS